MNRNAVARMNWINICIVVTNSGYGKPKWSCENIHLLYTESTVAKENLDRCDVRHSNIKWGSDCDERIAWRFGSRRLHTRTR